MPRGHIQTYQTALNNCNNENRSKVMCRITRLYQKMGGKVHPRFLPVAIIGISQHGKYWQIFFPHKILANMILAVKYM